MEKKTIATIIRDRERAKMRMDVIAEVFYSKSLKEQKHTVRELLGLIPSINLTHYHL